MGLHRGWYLHHQYQEDALIIGIFVVEAKEAIHLIDHCPSCHRRWKSLLSPCGRKRHFTELLPEDCDEGLRSGT